MDMEDVYVLKRKADNGIVMIADDREWLVMQLSTMSAAEQDALSIDNHDLFRIKSKGD